MSVWIANLSNGQTIIESQLKPPPSPWRQLMLMCQNGICLTNLRMSVGREVFTCKPNAVGYWHARGVNLLQNMGIGIQQGGAKSIQEVMAIGWVEGDKVMCIYSMIDPIHPDDVMKWRRVREAKGQNQIIWSK